jgi:hypothetical protein
MTRLHAVVVVVIAAAASSAALAADRLTDRDLKALVDRIDDERDRFEDALDGKFKHSILRGPGGEVNVERFLDDLQDNVDRLKERLKPEYAASTEVATVLRQGTSIARYFSENAPPGFKGESEWNRLATDLKALAAAYGAPFPLPENAPVRRMGDREVASWVAQVGEAASRLKKSLDTELKRDKTVDKAAREEIVGEADGLAKDAKQLQERLKDGQPSSAEADKLLSDAAKMQSYLESHQVPSSAGIWKSVAPRLQDLAGAYRGPAPKGT